MRAPRFFLGGCGTKDSCYSVLLEGSRVVNAHLSMFPGGSGTTDKCCFMLLGGSRTTKSVVTFSLGQIRGYRSTMSNVSLLPGGFIIQQIQLQATESRNCFSCGSKRARVWMMLHSTSQMNSVVSSFFFITLLDSAGFFWLCDHSHSFY